jgi:antitoxin VapB
MQTTKIFKNGNSQAVRIPVEYRFDQDEVFINKVGSSVVIFQPNDRLAVLMESLNEFTSDFLKDGRPSPLEKDDRETFN